MPTTRSYQDRCGIARALDVVGERWSLLIVRELLLGPQRYSDLRRVLTNTSSNVIADRLRELEANDVVRRRKLPPPAASWVYELTERGRQLEPILLALGEWGLQYPDPVGEAVLSPTTVLLYLRRSARPDPSDPPIVATVQLGDQAWTLRTHGGQLTIEPGEVDGASATLHTDPRTLLTLIRAPSQLRTALREGSASVTGDNEAIRRLLRQLRPLGKSPAAPMPAPTP